MSPDHRLRGAEVVVVGAGHNRLVAACYLAKAGADVLVLERWATPGGMTATSPMAPEAPDHVINEAAIHASLFRTTNIDAELGLSARPTEDWDTVRERVERNVLLDCARYYEGLGSLEIARRTLTPRDLEERFGAPDGNVHHVDPIITRFGPARPTIGLGGYRTPVPGLYLSGSGTHPIAGISGMPGMNAAKTLIRDLKNGAARLGASRVRVRVRSVVALREEREPAGVP